ncbi:hypothetical protein LINPERHAP1_LOCUS31156, partial [Linum perenne]
MRTSILQVQSEARSCCFWCGCEEELRNLERRKLGIRRLRVDYNFVFYSKTCFMKVRAFHNPEILRILVGDPSNIQTQAIKQSKERIFPL